MIIPDFIPLEFSAAALASLLTAALIILVRLGAHNDDVDPQHVHDGEIPRTGGGAILCGVLVGLVYADSQFPHSIAIAWLLLASSLPIFSAGIAEDLTGRVDPRWRYYASLASAILAYVLVDARLERLDVALFDRWLSYDAVCLVVTLFCVAGVAQAYNIVDGKNGLASGSAFIFFAVVALVVWHRGDQALALFAVACAGSAIGFLVLNFPRGWIFLGDGGAYLLGFYVAIVSVLLVARHPDVSAWFPLLLSAYPIMETISSIGRRLILERSSFDAPDHLHMHSLIYRRLNATKLLQHRAPWVANSLASVPFLCAAISVAALAIRFVDNTPALQIIAAVLCTAYILVYVALRRDVTSADTTNTEC